MSETRTPRLLIRGVMDVRPLIVSAGCSRGPFSGLGDRSALGRKVGVLSGLEVAGRALDTEAEEVAQTSLPRARISDGFVPNLSRLGLLSARA
jgi:hypothetical protein